MISKNDIFKLVAMGVVKKTVSKTGVMPVLGVAAVGTAALVLDKHGIITIPDAIKDGATNLLCGVLDNVI